MSYDYRIDDGQHAIDQQLELDWARGYQVINAAGGSNALSAGTNAFDVDAAAGDINFGGSTISCPAQTVNLSAEVDPDLPRKVTVYRDLNGDLTYAAGTAQAANPDGATRRNASEPAPPTLYNTDAVVLGTVWLAAGASSVTSADIRDRRMPSEANVARLGRNLDGQGNDITNLGSLSTGQQTITESIRYENNKTLNVGQGSTATLSLSFDGNYGLAKVLIAVENGFNDNLQAHYYYDLLTIDSGTAGGETAITELLNESSNNFQVSSTDFAVSRPSTMQIDVAYTNNNDADDNDVTFYVLDSVNISEVSIA